MAIPTKKAVAGATAVTPSPPKLEVASGLPFSEPTFTGEKVATNLLPQFQDIFFITGDRGAGKTTFTLGIERPENILFLDFEGKGKGLTNQLPGVNYFPIIEDVSEVMGMEFRGRAIWDRALQIISAVPEGRFTTLIIDNGAYLQDAAADMISDNPQAWGVKPQNAASGQFGGVWPGVKHAIVGFLAIARQKGIQLVVVTFQTKAAWTQAGPSLTKRKTTDVAIWHERSILTLALGPPLPGNVPIPSALVLKEQLPRITWNDTTGQLEVVRCLPFQLPRATMADIKNYLQHPADLQNPAPGEWPDMDAVDSYSPSFKREQLAQLMKIMELGEKLTAETETVNQ